MAQESKAKSKAKSQQEEAEVEAKDVKNEELDKSTEETLGEIDDLLAMDDILDEIDEVLERDAEEFVSNYVQRGGE